MASMTSNELFAHYVRLMSGSKRTAPDSDAVRQQLAEMLGDANIDFTVTEEAGDALTGLTLLVEIERFPEPTFVRPNPIKNIKPLIRTVPYPRASSPWRCSTDYPTLRHPLDSSGESTEGNTFKE